MSVSSFISSGIGFSSIKACQEVFWNHSLHALVRFDFHLNPKIYEYAYVWCTTTKRFSPPQRKMEKREREKGAFGSFLKDERSVEKIPWTPFFNGLPLDTAPYLSIVRQPWELAFLIRAKLLKQGTFHSRFILPEIPKEKSRIQCSNKASQTFYKCKGKIIRSMGNLRTYLTLSGLYVFVDLVACINLGRISALLLLIVTP